MKLTYTLLGTLAVAVLGAIGAFFLITPAAAQPTVAWTPSAVDEALEQGESKTISVSLVSTTSDISNATLILSPSLAPYVTLPTTTISLTRNVPKQLSLTIRAAAAALPGTYDGTLQVRGGSITSSSNSSGGSGSASASASGNAASVAVSGNASASAGSGSGGAVAVSNGGGGGSSAAASASATYGASSTLARPLPIRLTLKLPLIGKDIDQDGVWDDVEEAIRDRYQGNEELQKVQRFGAIGSQEAIILGNSGIYGNPDDIEKAKAIAQTISTWAGCLLEIQSRDKLASDWGQKEMSAVTSYIRNSPARNAADRNFDRLLTQFAVPIEDSTLDSCLP